MVTTGDSEWWHGEMWPNIYIESVTKNALGSESGPRTIFRIFLGDSRMVTQNGY